MGVECSDSQMFEGFLGLPHLDEDQGVAEDDDETGHEEVADVHHLDHHRTLVVLPDVISESLQTAEKCAQEA